MTGEYLPPPEHQGYSLDVLARALDLGYDMRPLHETPDDPNAFAERKTILRDVKKEINALRTGMLSAAASLDIPVDQEAMVKWAPKEGTHMHELRRRLRPQRVRMQMLDGLAEGVLHGGQGMQNHQKDARYATHNFLEKESRISGEFGKSGYIDMPTGSGKTATFVSLVKDLKSKEKIDDPIRVLVLVPTNPILEQTIGWHADDEKRKGFAKFWPEKYVGSYNYQNKDLDSDVVIMTNASFNGLMQEGRMPHFDAVIIDETHVGLGPNIMENLRNYFVDKLTIGFTATPEYHQEKTIADLLQHKIMELPLTDAIKGRILAPVSAELRELHLELDYEELPEDRLLRLEAIRKAYFKARLDDAMTDIKQAVKEGKGVLIRCPSGNDTAYAELAARTLQQERISLHDGSYRGQMRAAALGGSKQKTEDQRLLMEGFNEGQVHVLCYVSLINMGADLPPCKLLVNLAPTSSRVVMVQAIGRALRLQLDERGVPVEAQIIDYADPRLKDQYTCLDALELKHGVNRLGHGIPYQSQYLLPPDIDFEHGPTVEEDVPDLDAVATIGSIGAIALAHEELTEEERMDESLRYEAEDALLAAESHKEEEEDETLISQAEADMWVLEDICEEFDLDPQAVLEYMSLLGQRPSLSIPREDYEAIVEMMLLDQETAASPTQIDEPHNDETATVHEEAVAPELAPTPEDTPSAAIETADTIAPEPLHDTTPESVPNETPPTESRKKKKERYHPAPEGYVDVRIYMERLEWQGGEGLFLQELRQNGFEPKRYMGSDGKSHWYIPRIDQREEA